MTFAATARRATHRREIADVSVFSACAITVKLIIQTPCLNEAQTLGIACRTTAASSQGAKQQVGKILSFESWTAVLLTVRMGWPDAEVNTVPRAEIRRAHLRADRMVPAPMTRCAKRVAPFGSTPGAQ